MHNAQSLSGWIQTKVCRYNTRSLTYTHSHIHKHTHTHTYTIKGTCSQGLPTPCYITPVVKRPRTMTSSTGLMMKDMTSRRHEDSRGTPHATPPPHPARSPNRFTGNSHFRSNPNQSFFVIRDSQKGTFERNY